MPYCDLIEAKDVFVRRVVRLINYVAADPYLNMYYFYDDFLPRMVFRLEDVPGFRLVLDGRPKPARGDNPMQLGIGTGVFLLGEEGLVDPDAFAEGFYMFAPYNCIVVVTDEEGFPEHGRRRWRRLSDQSLRSREAKEALLVSDRGMTLDCEESEIDRGVVETTCFTDSEELARVFGGPI